MEKRCSECKQIKVITEFNKCRSGKYGVHNVCRECKNKQNKLRSKADRHQKYFKNRQHILDKQLEKNYGITRDKYNELLIKQDYLCAICGRHESESNKGLHTDHCHETNKVRGLLCNSCNLAIGMLKHNVTILTKAIKYLGG